MDRTSEKLSKFTEMVMMEASRQKNELKTQAEREKEELLAASELQYLKHAYEKIQEAVRKIEKTMNEDISKAIVESKQALFNRRDEIINMVFGSVRDRIMAYRKTDDYRQTLESWMKRAMEVAGEGELRVLADQEDLELMESLRGRLGLDYKVVESENPLLGGFLVINRTKGFIWDYSFERRLSDERQSFLEKHQLSIEQDT